MNLPGFTAEASVYNRRWSHTRGSGPRRRTVTGAIPAIPPCRNCDYILDNCERNGWKPRAVCNACAVGNCDSSQPPGPGCYLDAITNRVICP
jgi:hypothetical protein